MDKELQIRIDRNGIKECSRLVKNVSENKFSLSKGGSVMYVTSNDISFNGETGDLVVKSPVDKYITKEMHHNPDFAPTTADAEAIPLLFGMLQNLERERYGKSFEEMELHELLSNEEIGRDLFKEARPISELFAK
jgi:hypothetical protein